MIAPVDLPHFDNPRLMAMPCVTPISTRRGNIAQNFCARDERQKASVPLTRGEAIRIFTGAPMPKDADTVFMQEDVREENGSVIVPSGLKRGANRRLSGEDLKNGSIAIPAGRIIDAQNIALAAALGLKEIEVLRRIRVAIFSTGNEVVEAGESAYRRKRIRRQPRAVARIAHASRLRSKRSRYFERRA